MAPKIGNIINYYVVMGVHTLSILGGPSHTVKQCVNSLELIRNANQKESGTLGTESHYQVFHKLAT